MTDFTPIIFAIEQSDDYVLKARMTEYLFKIVSDTKLSGKEKKELSAFAFNAVETLIRELPKVPDYKTKDGMIEYEDIVLALLTKLYAKLNNIPTPKMVMIRALIAAVDKERYFENALQALMESENIETEEVERLLAMQDSIEDEYQRGQLYSGLLHYKYNIANIPEEGRALIADRIASESERYLGGELDEVVLGNLEIIGDIAKYFAADATVALLYKLLKLEISHIGYYALESLLSLGKDLSSEEVEPLAKDLSYANLTYCVLEKYGKEALFPTALANEEYLAKSDLVHWLTYPTELGKEPDRIEYLGKTEVDEENYYIFRFLSDSDTLDEELKNKWLIGWSGDQGGTFSHFDEYALFEQATPEETVECIRAHRLADDESDE